MKTAKLFTVLALSAGLITAANAAPSPINANKITKRGSVNYVCQNAKKVTVNYGFNAAGIPVTATLKVDGVNRVLRYDRKYSNDTSMMMTDKRGYKLGSGYMDSKNFRKVSGINIFDPSSYMLFKGCEPRRR